MARIESSFRNMVVSLTAICLVCASLLGVVSSLTGQRIDEIRAEKVNSGIKAVLPAFDNVPAGEMFVVDGCEVYPATLGGTPVGWAVKVAPSGFGGPIQMLVGFTPDGTVYNTSVLSHSETPGLGAKISDPQSAPRAMIVGKNPAHTKIAVSRDGGEIDAITASTITSRAFLSGIEKAYGIFMKKDGTTQ